MDAAPLSFASRFFFAFACFFRVLFDGSFAARAFAVRAALPEPPAPEPPAPEPPAPEPPAAAPVDAALQLLALLQREGRFVDFVQQDIDAFSDADVGAAARLVHRGVRKAVKEHLDVQPVREEPEGASVMIPSDYDSSAVKLTGNVSGSGPYSGVVRHRGWRVVSARLPQRVGDVDVHVLAAAEVEL